jgi:hypothetical protein
MNKLWGLIKRHKIITSILFTAVMVTAVLGVQITPTKAPNKSSVSIGQIGQKYEITIGSGVDASQSADYTATGTAAQQTNTFQIALNALPTTGGILTILSGNYTLNATLTRAIPNVTIDGIGNSTIFSDNGSTPIFAAGSTGWNFQNLVLDAGGISGVYTAYNITIGTQYVGTGRGATITIAASNTTALEKAQADYICSGTADQTAINSEIASLSSTGGDVHLDTGTFNLTGPITFSGSSITVEGEGLSTIISVNADVDGFDLASLYGQVKNLYIISNIARGGGYGILIENDHCVVDNVNIGVLGGGHGYLYNGIGVVSNAGINGGIIYDPIISNCHINDCVNESLTINQKTSNGQTLSNIIINNQDTSAKCIAVYGTGGIIGTNITTFKGSYGLFVQSQATYNTGAIYLTNFEADTTSVDGIHIDGTLSPIYTVSIDGLWIVDCGGYGFYSEWTSVIQLSHIECYNNTKDGIYLGAGSSRISISQGDMYHNNQGGAGGYTAHINVQSGFCAINGITFYCSGSPNEVAYCILGAGSTAGTVSNCWWDGNKIFQVLGSAGWKFYDNNPFNPVGKITNPIGTGTIGLAGSGTSVTSTTIYTVTGVDCYITSTGGTVTNIVLKDPSGNIMETGATTLSYVHLPIGYSITWTDSVAPTVTVFGN